MVRIFHFLGTLQSGVSWQLRIEDKHDDMPSLLSAENVCVRAKHACRAYVRTSSMQECFVALEFGLVAISNV
jgi:hypothetical protein